MKKLHHKHKNLLFLVLGILAAIILSRLPFFTNFLTGLGKFGYLGTFFAGMLFASTFTVSIGALILIELSQSLPALPLIIFSALGAVFCDFLIFKFVKDSVTEEITPIYEEMERLDKKNHLRKLIHTKYFAWTLPVIGALIILSPLPDELGVSLLGISNIKTYRFMIISLCSHGLGMTLLISAASVIS